MIAWLMGSFAAFLLIGVPIAVSIGAATVLTLLVSSSVPALVAVQRMYTATDSFPLMAIPFFILAGNIMDTAGLSRRLIDFCAMLVGKVRGGLGYVAILTSMFFSAISGSGPATTAAIGGIMVPAMTEAGYDKKYAAALQASAGAMGPIIPPSVLFVGFGVVTGYSISALFMTGIISGLLIGFSFMVVNFIVAKKHNYVGVQEKVSGKAVWTAFKRSIGVLLMPIIVLGGIYGGFFTPTEAAIVACAYSLVLGLFIYRELKWKDIPRTLVNSGLTSAMIMLVIACASAFSWLMASQRIPDMLATWALSITSNKTMILLIINIILLIAGCLLDGNSAVIILAPIFMPIVLELGMNPIHFGCVMVVNLCLGMLTPPVGTNLYVACGISKLGMADIVPNVMKFLIAALIVLMMLTYIPWISLVLPQALGLC